MDSSTFWFMQGICLETGEEFYSRE